MADYLTRSVRRASGFVLARQPDRIPKGAANLPGRSALPSVAIINTYVSPDAMKTLWGATFNG